MKNEIRLTAGNLKATISGVEYTWYGGFGVVLESREQGIRQNDVRMIGNVVFYAFSVENCGWKRRVGWSPQQRVDTEWLHEFKQAIFGS